MPETEPPPITSRPFWRAAAIGLVAILLVGALLVVTMLPGLSSTRNEPPAAEVAIATWLLHHSVPSAARSVRNPLGKDGADIAAGRDLFRQKCEVCHAYDGGGRTEIGAGSYPRPPELRALVPTLSDGEIFYHIRNGIRNTAMPAWNFPDRQVWQLVAYVRHLPIVASMAPAERGPQFAASPTAHYVGSAACAACHQDIHARWRKTAMANVVRDPKVHPEAVIGDFSKPDPLVTFKLSDVDFVYGSIWKQRYFHKVGDTYRPYPVQWDATHKKWAKYHVLDTGGDWWAAHYPDPAGDNSNRPTGPLCDGCHSVNFNIATSQPTEWNVGCETCHGAGSDHVAAPKRTNVFNPARVDYVQASDTCIQCHSQGQPTRNPIGGKVYDWPVGFHVGERLADFWKLEPHTLGELSFTHFPDGTGHKNRMQGNDYVQSLMYERGVTCFSCHDPHGTPYPAMLRKPVAEICATCHGPNSQNGPHAPTIEAHTHHVAGSAGSECVSCHMPKIEQTIGDVNVAAHTFRFITPAQSEAMRIPNACTQCHSGKSNAWATAALAKWGDRSPWRMQ
jgi:predicted CXXCH cytochrome family protein